MAKFPPQIQRLLIKTLIACEEPLRVTVFGAATDTSHIHPLVRWTDPPRPEQVRERLKQTLSRTLNEQVRRRAWFVRNGWCEPVTEEKHMDWLREEYLPDHRGWCWDRDKGWQQPNGLRE